MEALLRERCPDLTEHEVKHAAQALTKPDVGITNQTALLRLEQQDLKEAGQPLCCCRPMITVLMLQWVCQTKARRYLVTGLSTNERRIIVLAFGLPGSVPGKRLPLSAARLV